MTLQLDCPVDGCSGLCEGETEEEIMEQAEAHVADAHPNLELDEETVQQLKSEISEA